MLWEDLVKAPLKKKIAKYLGMDETTRELGGGITEIQEDSVLRASQESPKSQVLHYGVIDVGKTTRHSNTRSVHGFKLNQNFKILYYLFTSWPTISSSCSTWGISVTPARGS